MTATTLAPARRRRFRATDRDEAIDLLAIDRLAVTIGDKPILTDVSLSVASGEIVGLLGPNGAGKSTTIATALGLLPAQRGVVRVFGQDPRRVPTEVYRDLGVLPEQNGFYDWMSGESYLTFFARLRGEATMPETVAGWLAAVGLVPRPGQRIGTYSRGIRQRLGLARALIGSPKLVILDEPTNGLDPRGRREVHDLLSALAAQGAGILLCTHLLDDVERLCRRVAVIAGGRTLLEGSVADLMNQTGENSRYRLRLAAPPLHQEAVAGVRAIARDGDTWGVQLDPGVDADAVWRKLFSRGWRITEVHREDRGLESVYVSLVDAAERSAA